MRVAELPLDENVRLETLRALNILDTRTEERFDRLTRMARRVFDVPIALVSLVDENRQWFKSCAGLTTRETARDVSFCAHAILDNDVLVIPNALEDERFADNPLVQEDPRIRFYAGCPLKAPDGSKLGSFCVIDRKPRKFTREDIDSLKDLASLAERELAAVEMATVDELTNISNRRGFLLLAQQSLHMCVRNGLSASLVFFDLDKFKPINDQFGHSEGDRALIAFADLMRRTYRNSDLIARLGGDEFVALLTDTSRQVTAEIVARFGELLAAYNSKVNRGYRIEYSHGIAEFNPDKHKNMEAFLAEGDTLMYLAKNRKD